MSVPFDQYLKARSAFGATIDASGRVLYFLSNASGVPNLLSLRLDQPNAQPEPMVMGSERVQFAFPSARPGRLLFGLDHGGDEHTQLYLSDGPGHTPRALTMAPDTLHTFGDWHADGRSIAYAANSRDPRYFDIYVLDVERGEPRCVHQHDSTNRALGFEPDGRRLLIERVHTPSHHELLLVDPRDGS